MVRAVLIALCMAAAYAALAEGGALVPLKEFSTATMLAVLVPVAVVLVASALES